MRYRLIEGETIDLTKTVAAKKSVKTKIDLSEENKVTGVVVFNSKHQVLPHVSKWLTEKLLSGKTPPGTIITYAKNFSYLFDYLQEHRIYKNHLLDDALLDIEVHTFEEYFVYLKADKGLASTTISNRDATFLCFFDEYLTKARKNGNAIREDNPYEEGLINGTAKSKIIEMCSLDELTALLQCAHSERERVLVQFTYDAGLRRSEVPRVYKHQIDKALNTDSHTLILDEGTIAVPPEYKALYVAGSKGRKREIKERFTLPSIHTLGRVKRYFSSPEYRKLSKSFGIDAPAFINSQGRPYSPGSIGKILHKLSKRAMKKGLIDRYIHPHMLRHGFAGSVLRSPDLGEHSVDKLVLVQRCLGHSQLRTTQIYTSLPYDIYGQVADSNGEILTRSRLMELINSKTKKTVKLR
jgi:integrase/recombinase XerC